MTMHALIVGLVAGFMGPFMGVPTILYAAKYIFQSSLGAGLAVGIGNSLVQIIWSAIAAACMYSGASTGALDAWTTWIGVAVVFFVAYKLWTGEGASEPSQVSGKKAFVVGALLTLVAPQRILLYVGVFAAFGVHYGLSDLNLALPLVIGVVVASLVWWVLFVMIVGSCKKSMTEARMRSFTCIGAILLVLIGLFSICNTFFAK